MLSLTRDIESKKKKHPPSGILQSLPYTIFDIQSSTSKPNGGDIRPRCGDHTIINQTKLTEMVKEKNLHALREFGGVRSVANSLETNLESGISGSDDEPITLRRKMFGSNAYEKPPSKGFSSFVLQAFKSTTILILLVCAAVSFGSGIKRQGVEEGCYEGGSILVAIFLFVVVSALSSFRLERHFYQLCAVRNNIKVDVVRDGRRQQISIFDVVVGDIVFLKTGDQIPADGLFIDGQSLKVEELSKTGESKYVEADSSESPFLLSGSKVANGYARMLVTSVGMMSSITQYSYERTPLQARLDTLTSSIAKASLAAANFLVLVINFVHYFTGKEGPNGNRQRNGDGTDMHNHVLNVVARFIGVAVSLVVVAIPEGLPLAVTLTLAYSMKKMMADQTLVRNLSACETMGSGTIICTKKTGNLTTNQMKVTKFWLGQEAMEEDPYNGIAPAVIELIHQGVGLNTAGSFCMHVSGSEPEFSGSPTEKAILSWAVRELAIDMEKLKQNYIILHVETFRSEKRRSGVSIRKKSDDSIHVHWKGAAEMILAMCSNYYENNGSIKPIDEDERNKYEKIIECMAASGLRCIAFAHEKISNEEILADNEDGETNHELKEDGLTLLGIIGLKDSCRPGVKKAVETCISAGVDIKMITGDNVFTAKAIATQCGILKTDQQVNNEEVVEGIGFQNYTHEERMQKIDKIRVMARSSPFDKLLMVQCLKQKGHVVAFAGDGTNDALALKEADIGLSMGIQGTEVAKDISDIVILDGNFTSIATVLRWGRCVYNNTRKFIQFQLTVNVSAFVINFIAAVSSRRIPLEAVQLLWVNLIMDTLGALALATEGPTDEIMQGPPVGRTEPLITNIMWRNLFGQALYQIGILLTLHFKGKRIFGVGEEVKDTMVFNVFALCQIFNKFNSRKLEKKNAFEGIHKNRIFLGIVGLSIFLQVVMVEFLKKFARTHRLNGWQWVTCVVIAAASWAIGWVVKLIPVPEKPFLSYLKKMRIVITRASYLITPLLQAWDGLV